MTSETKRATNRRNAARSTGPKSAAGKKRASQNALRHGLAIALRQDAAARAEIERMAKLISGDGASRLKYELALVRAESEIVLRRAHMARVAIIERAMNAVHVRTDQGQPRGHPGRGAAQMHQQQPPPPTSKRYAKPCHN
jgi:hypothetical protein